MAEYKAIPPAEQPFNVYGPAYGNYLQQQSGDYATDIAHEFALRRLSQGEPQRYMQALAAANASQLQGQGMNDQSDLTMHSIDQLANATDKGVGSVLAPYLPGANTGALLPASTVHLNATEQGAFKDKAAALKDIVESGYKPSNDYLRGMMTGTLQDTPADYLPAPEGTPHDVNDAGNVKANMLKAQAADYLAHHPHSGAGIGGGGEVVTMTDQGFGMPPIVVIKGGKGQDPASVAAALENARNGTQGQTGDRRPGAGHGKWVRKNGKIVKE